MKIHQAAELVGITKKNIRFYEDQGLIKPERDSQNGYREYSMDDVRELEKVKLLRQLGVSCENIRRVQAGDLCLAECMKERLTDLEETSRSIDHMKTLCGLLSEEGAEYPSVDAAALLDRMKDLAKGGGRFMDVEKSDIRRRKTGSIIAAAAVILLMLALIAAIFLDAAPAWVLIFAVVVYGGIIAGVVIALDQRLKEVRKGEIDEARKY